MRLSKTAIAVIRGWGVELKDELAIALGVSTNTIYRLISENNDDLTKASAVKVIRERTGLTNEQILEEETPVEKVASA